MTAPALRTLRAYAGLAGRILGTRLGSIRPFKVTWMLTDRCDCRCEGCRIWEQPKRSEMTAPEIETVLRDAPSIRWVNLTGGEPFLRTDMVAIAQAAQRALPGLAVLDFPTTGQRTDQIVSECAEIARLGIPRVFVTVSIEGPPELHDRQRGRAGAFEHALETFHRLRAIPGLGVWLGMTLHEGNADRIEETLSAASARGPAVDWSDLHFNVYTVSGHYYANAEASLRAPGSLDDVIRRVLRERQGSLRPVDWVEAAYLKAIPEYLRTGRSPVPCQSLKANVFIEPHGDVHPCTVYGRVLGNVRQMPLYAILAGDVAKDARSVIARDACPGCWSPCEAFPTIVASAPQSLWAGASSESSGA